MRPVSRRRALSLAGLGLIGTAAGGIGVVRLLRSDPPSAPPVTPPWSEPTVLASRDGLLNVRLEAREGQVVLAGRPATVLGYNGSVPGPTLRLWPGDRLQVELVNRLTGATNLHTHGLHVSPVGHGDNPFVRVGPGESFRYEMRLPDVHPPGVYWYHPHRHGSVADQVFAGLYGAIVVEDPAPLPGSEERVLVISDISLDDTGRIRQPSAMARVLGREGALVLTNGQVAPTLAARAGHRQRWRIVNACVARYLRLRLDGQQLHLLGVDSGRASPPQEVTELVLAPGNRADLLLTPRTGVTRLRTLAYDRGGTGGMGMGDVDGSPPNRQEVTLATLDVAAAPPGEIAPLPLPPPPRDLRGELVAARRELTLGMGLGMGRGGMSFTIDGRAFDGRRIDQAVARGTVEEWTWRNPGPLDHPIHLHVWPMQVISGPDGVGSAPVWRDVVNVPARGTVTVRVAFDGGVEGRTVYHCHVLDHEDGGMMGTVEVG